ncbi:MAG: threonine--tRNA ligase [Chitinophagales bacterium]|nr:threonine--tRNA ligase [Chitinophagales bacterium]
MIDITFPDGRVQTYPKGTSALEIAKSISEGLARQVIAAEVNGEVRDLNRPINESAKIAFLKFEDKGGKKAFWHSTAHLMAEALESLYPGIKLGIGPPIENGFYYDIDFGDYTFGEADLEKVENKMKELAKQNNEYLRSEVSKDKALAFFTEKNDPYKLELIEALEDGNITFYTQGNFVDLCKGPHIPNTGIIKAVKLLSLAGAYWRGNEKNKMLTRIYGVSFPKQSLLDEHLQLLEEAKKRDHRRLGAELQLFMFSEKVGAGLPIWLPKGTFVRNQLENYLKEEQLKRGYQQVITPHIANKNLYITSGHYAKYGEGSFQPIKTPNENEEFFLKPMNCPHHCEIFKHVPHSYRELPIRIAEFGTVYRYEQSGELHGLSRVRSFTQDDAHIFCMPDQLKDEFLNVLDLTMQVLNRMGFSEFTAQISLRDPENKEKYIGSDEVWEKAESAIIDATREIGIPTITELGEAAFYGPKLDFMVKDALGRSWQLGTIQVDYNLPERFDLEYVASDNTKHRPVMIHRAPFGSFERFISLLIESTAGNFPLWLAPTQVMILPISDKFNAYAQYICDALKKDDFRAEIDQRQEKIGKKIRDAEVSKTPYMLIVGEKEELEGLVSARKHGQGDIGSMALKDFMLILKNELN